MPSFSLSVPIGAYHDLLPTCLASLAAQRGELRVSLLDASGDPRVGALADRFDGLFAYRRHGPDQGQSESIIEGWRAAPGEILGWLNADDFLYPGAIAAVADRFRTDPSVDVVTGHSAICDRAGRMTGYHWAVSPAGEALRKGCNISQPSCFFRRDAAEKAGGLDHALHYTMDWDLWLRLLQSGAKFDFIDRPLSVVYWGEGTKTSGLGAERRSELERIITRYGAPGSRMRMRRGFALRAMLDSIGSASVKNALEGALRREKPFVMGIGPNGEIADEAEIRWMHYREERSSTLIIECIGEAAINVSADREITEVSRGANEIKVRFRDEVPAAAEVAVTLNKKSRSTARLKRCYWR